MKKYIKYLIMSSVLFLGGCIAIVKGEETSFNITDATITLRSMYYVSRGTNTWSIEHFMYSGMFCEFISKHEWIDVNCSEPGINGGRICADWEDWRCKRCGKKREKRIIETKSWQWEK